MRKVLIAVYDGVELLDVTGPAEVFSVAGRLVRDGYDLDLVGAEPGPIRTARSIRLIADRSFSDALEADTAIVPEVVARAQAVQVRQRSAWARPWTSSVCDCPNWTPTWWNGC